MNILVYEYITGGGKQVALDSALAREGDLMVSALTRDLADIPGLRLHALRDARLTLPPGDPRTRWLWVDPGEDANARFLACLSRVDAVWPIAPETGGILERLCAQVEAGSLTLLNTPARGIRLLASKLDTLDRLARHGIPTVPTLAWTPADTTPPFDFPMVIKTDDGAGCEGARILRDGPDWDGVRMARDTGRRAIQPLMQGEALSLCALFREGEGILLSINRQGIRQDRRGFALEGCTVNVMADPSGGFAALVGDIARAIPELWGYAGIDLIRNPAGLRVLEVNPRLTTSYAGLRAALALNPARLVIDLWRSRSLPPSPAYTGRVVEVGRAGGE